MEICIVHSDEDRENKVREMAQKQMFLASMSNTGMERGWRLTFLPAHSFTRPPLDPESVEYYLQGLA
jgi:hypothetical protein